MALAILVSGVMKQRFAGFYCIINENQGTQDERITDLHFIHTDKILTTCSVSHKGVVLRWAQMESIRMGDLIVTT